MAISIERVKDVFYGINSDTEAVYLPEKDEFVYISDYIDEEIDLDEYDGEIISFPSHYDINNYRMMQDFIEDKVTGDAQGWLANAIRGKGAFHRFKVTCDRFGLLRDWYEYEDSRYEDMAVNWCEENGLEYYFERKQIIEEDDEEKIEVEQVKDESVRIVKIDEKNSYALTYMVVDFRKELAALKNHKADIDLDAAQAEINYYLSRHYPVFAASISGVYVGYAVCKVEDDVAWLESIYVRKDHRRKKVATALLKEVEKVGEELGNPTLYINIHPNNEAVINFLNHNGYDVLNLIEVRKKYPTEKPKSEYEIGNHKYRY